MTDDKTIQDVVEKIAFQINHSFPPEKGKAAMVGTIYQKILQGQVLTYVI